MFSVCCTRRKLIILWGLIIFLSPFICLFIMLVSCSNHWTTAQAILLPAFDLEQRKLTSRKSNYFEKKFIFFGNFGNNFFFDWENSELIVLQRRPNLSPRGVLECKVFQKLYK